jgi:hypothetical protein
MVAASALSVPAGRLATTGTNDAVEQLQVQLEAERKKCQQQAFNAAEYERQIAMLLKELGEARLELARRDLVDAFASAASPSPMKH